MEQNMNASVMEGLSPAALSALAALGALDEADRAAVLRVHALALGPRLWRVQDGADLPRLTRLVPERDREAVYGSDAWAAGYRPQGSVVAYMLQASGLGALSARLGGLGLAKAGTAARDAVERRIADLGREEYGGWHRGPRRYERAAGYGAYSPAARLQVAPQHPLSPVRLGLYGVEVGLPAGLTRNRFESEYNRRLLPLRLHVFAATAAGRDACARTGVEPSELVRYYRRGPRYRASTELTLLRPQADCNAFSKVCADIVIDHVLGLLPQRSGR